MAWTDPNRNADTSVVSSVGSNVTAMRSGASDNWEKAVGFLNLNLRSPEGGNVKLGFIALKASDPTHVKILNWIDKHGAEKVCAELGGDISIDYNPNEKKERGLALDEMFGS